MHIKYPVRISCYLCRSSSRTTKCVYTTAAATTLMISLEGSAPQHNTLMSCINIARCPCVPWFWFRGVCRKLGQGGEGHVATTHTMSGVYRKWDLKPRNPMPSPAWNTAPKDTVLANTSRVIPGAGGDATGKVSIGWGGRGQCLIHGSSSVPWPVQAE